MNDNDSGIRRVVDLYVNCSYPMREDVMAASDTCQQPADTAVGDGPDRKMYRCPEHRGLTRRNERGPVYTTVRVIRPS